MTMALQTSTEKELPAVRLPMNRDCQRLAGFVNLIFSI
jgi:hypothetical protein